MATVEGSYGFTAPAEVVFGVLTDPDRTTRWLPRGLAAEPAGPGAVRVRAGNRVYEYDVQVTADRLQLTWSAREGTGVSGSAEVLDAPAGGSVVRAAVAVPGHPADDKRLRDLLAETMWHLQRDVSDNFNAG